MAYLEIGQLRDSGVSEEQADDEMLSRLISEATYEIDAATGLCFEPRELTLRLSGLGTPSLTPPLPPIELSAVTVDGFEVSPMSLNVIGAPFHSGEHSWQIILKWGVFWGGLRNVLASGYWGYTVEDGSAMGRTPPDINRACMLLVQSRLPDVGGTGASSWSRHYWRIIGQRTRSQSVTFAPLKQPEQTLTGHPEVDQILLRYRRPLGMGAV